MSETLLITAICLITSFIFSEIFFRMGYPRVIGQILAGVFLGLPAFAYLFTSRVVEEIHFLSDLGIVFLLLLTGLEINLSKFKKVEKDSILIALFSSLLPFTLGFVLMKLIGYGNIVALVVGASLSITAEATNLKVLLDMRALNSKIGLILLSSGIIDDLIEILLLSGILVIAAGAVKAAIWFPFKLGLFTLVVFASFKFFPIFLKSIQKEHSRVTTFSLIAIFGIIVAGISKFLGLGPVIGAFIAGVIIRITECAGPIQCHGRYEYHEIIKEMRVITFGIIVPFFFINIGLNFDITHMAHYGLIGMVVLVATVGKVMGSVIATPFTDLSLRQTHLIGWGLNSRGAIELVLAEIARQKGLIPPEVYTAIVAMAVITTLAFPIIMKTIVKYDRNILHDEPKDPKLRKRRRPSVTKKKIIAKKVKIISHKDHLNGHQ